MKSFDQKFSAAFPSSSPHISTSLQLAIQGSATEAEVDKAEDIFTLESIKALIDQFIAAPEVDTDILQEIGNQAKKLKFKDSSPSYIRNKYGMLDRNRGSAMRLDALELNHLEALAQIGAGSSSLANVAKLWRDDFGVIKQKITLILEAEKEPVVKSYEQVLSEFAQLPKPTNFVQNVGRLYVEKIAAKILEVLNDQNLAKLNFANREDRYYFSNILLKVGELSRELIEFTNPDQESGLFGFFKKIRNAAAHSPQLMIDDLNEEQIKNLHLLKNILGTDLALSVNSVINHDESYDLGDSTEEEKKWQKNFLKSIFVKNKNISEVVNGGWNLLNKDQKEISKNLLTSLSEIEYIQWVMKNEAINPAKKNYIIEFGIAKVAHCLNDANKTSNPLLQKHGKNAMILQGSWLDTIRARNEKIAHGAISFDKTYSPQELANNILTMRGDIAALLDISSIPLDAINAKIAEDVSDFRYRGDLSRIAYNHIRIGNSAEAQNILKQALQYFDSESPIIALSKDTPLISMIVAIADKNAAAQFLCENQYFEKAEDNFFEAEDLFSEAIRLANIPSFVDSLGRGESMSQALSSLDEQSKDETKLLLSVDYFNTQLRILRLLSQTYSDAEPSILESLYGRIAELEEKTYGSVLKETLMLQGFLLKGQGRKVAAQEKFDVAAQLQSNNKMTDVETLIHQSQSFGNNGQITQARECLKLAEEIANSKPIHHFAKLMALCEVVIFEATQGGNIDRSLLYLERLQQFFKEHELQFKSAGNAFVGAEQIMMQAGITAVNHKYLRDATFKNFALSKKDIKQLEQLYDQAQRLHRLRGEDYDDETWKMRVGSLAMTFEIVSRAASNHKDFAPNLLEKSASLKTLYQISGPHFAASKMMVIQDDVMRLAESLAAKIPMAELVSQLNAVYNKMISFSQKCDDSSLKNSENWKECVKCVSNMFVRISSIDNPERSFDFLSKSFALKDLCQITKTKTDLFIMASCQSRLEGEDEAQHMQEAIQRIEQAKLAVQEGSTITDINIYNLAGDLYDIVGNFPEAIKNYRFVLDNSQSEEQKQKADFSIANALQGAREARAKKIKFQSIETVLVKAYESTKASASKIVIASSAISKEDLEEYLRQELKIKDPVVNKSSGELKINLTEKLKAALDERLTTSKQAAKGGR